MAVIGDVIVGRLRPFFVTSRAGRDTGEKIHSADVIGAA